MHTVYCVLRTGGDYTVEHVERLRKQITDCRIEVITDEPAVANLPLGFIGMRYAWPGWWSKMELFRPDIPGDICYLDLDSLVVGPLADIIETAARYYIPVLLRDFYRPTTHLQSSFMFLPKAARVLIWEAWARQGPANVMACYGKLGAGFNGDQNFIQDTLAPWPVARWQDLFPGAFLSYKVDIQQKRNGIVGVPPEQEAIPPGARIVFWHGRPRPWATKWG